MNRYKIFYDQQLGSGNFATVYRGLNLKDNTHVAIKVFDKTQILMDEVKRKSMRAQFKAIQIQCENILKYIQIAQCENNYYMIMQQCEFDLRKVLNNKIVNQQDALEYLKQIVNGLKHLFQKNILHRDLKPQNILIKNNVIKIGDFGSSTILLHPSIELDQVAGSIIYMSPQALKGQKYSSTCDIWSIGVLFYELLHGKTPWYVEGDTKKTLLQKITKNTFQFEQKIPEKFKKFIRKCLQINRYKRISWEYFLADSIFGDKFYDFFMFQDNLNSQVRYFLRQFNKKISSNGIKCSKFFQAIYPNKTELDIVSFKKIVKWVNTKISHLAVYKLFQKLDINHNGLASAEIFIRLCTALKQQQENTQKHQVLQLKKNISAPQSNSENVGRNEIVQEFHGTGEIEFSQIIQTIQAKISVKKLQSQFKKACQYSKYMNAMQFCNFLKKLIPELSTAKANIVYKNIRQEDKNIWLDSLLKLNNSKKCFQGSTCKQNSSTISIQTVQSYQLIQKKNQETKKRRIFVNQR